MIAPYEPEHVAKGLDLLLYQYKGKPVIEGFLSALLLAVQTSENELRDLLSACMLPPYGTAQGAFLDLYGRIVGEPRAGRLDAQYLNALRIRILANRSKGRPDDLIAIGLLASKGPVAYSENYPASWHLELFDVASVTSVVKILKRAGALATSSQVVISSPLASAFLLGSVSGDSVTPEQGLGSISGGPAGDLSAVY